MLREKVGESMEENGVRGFREADRLEVTVLMDNYVNNLLLESGEFVRRPNTVSPETPLIAQHAFSCLLEVYRGGERHAVLFDTGVDPNCLFHNASILGKDLQEVEAVVLSHGSYDHYGGLLGFYERAPDGIPLVVHPDAFSERRDHLPGSGPSPPRMLNRGDLERLDVPLHERRGPSLTGSGLVMVSGEVERSTDFEKGYSWGERRVNGRWEFDPIDDDQAVAVGVKGKGLVVVGGCSHSGVISTVRHFQRVSGVRRTLAVMGGFHLTGPEYDPVVPLVIEAMRDISPEVVVPMHCTGWRAINRFEREMPDRFLLSSVGSTYVFE
ncbi:MAG: MBL fold metallo-hydrolase [Thermoplasmatota archaeon]